MSTVDKQTANAADPAAHTSTPRVELHDIRLTVADGYATLHLGRTEESMVTLTESRIEQIEVAIRKLATTTDLRGVTITGPGPGMFCAGADVNLIRDITVAKDGETAAIRGRSVFAMLQDLKVPVVAAIEGPCLGGGFELALFCDVRVASNAKATQIGLPEVKLGIVPGFGGTQNLTRLVGLPKALELILNGKLMRGKQALRARIIDRLVPANKLLAAAREEIDKLAHKQQKSKARKLRGMAWWLSHTPLRTLAVRAANKALNKGQARFYPAPKRALQCCVDALRLQPKDGFAREAKALGDMIVTKASKGLVHLFFLTERQKRLGKHKDAKDLNRAVVIGGGVMGAGIASQFATKGMPTRLCDVALEPLAAAKARLQKGLDKLLKRRRIQPHEATTTQDRLAVSTSSGHLRDSDLWIEAVVENLSVKQKIMSDAIAHGLPDDAILATNTSSLSVTAMQEQIAHPERVVGIHFFNPPEKMPLVEVIRGKHTSDSVVATACRLALRLGKYPIVVKDSAGFLVNRCLSPYINEAARMLLEGTSPEAIDSAMLDFGMPMGPCRLLDEVGFDVADKVSDVMQQAFPDRMQPCDLFAAMVKANALGQKTNGGIYGKGGKGQGPGRTVIEDLREQRATPARSASRSELLHRLVYPLIDEAYRCLEEGLIEDEQDLDLGLVMGMGFPPFTGGITRFAKNEGLGTIVSKLDELSRSLNARFAPCDGLRRRSLNG
jgi:3-hydroxyacyl-CoA dehydrogenase/enoyl-CoA hydratase/3-hydroxybutyryl-CoA epimerase